MRRTAFALAFAAASAAARADLAPPTPPRIPEGIADARGELGIFRARDTGVVAVDLSTGEVRWTSAEGEWPLYADLSTVAVAAIEPRNAGALRVRLLRIADGRRVLESHPVTLPTGLAIPDPRKLPGRTTPSFTVSGWVLPFTRGSNERDGRLRVRWEWSFTPVYGYRRPSPEETRRASGVVLIDPANGQVTPGNDEERQVIPRAELPPTFKPDPRLLYWAFSDHGASWSSAPEQKDGHQRVLLHDLAQGGTAPIAEMPAFWRHCRPPFAILDDRMLCVHEAGGEPVEGGTAFAREMVALRTRTGERSWSAAIAPRLLPAPVPGGGR